MPEQILRLAGALAVAAGVLVIWIVRLAHSHQLALTDELTGLGNRRAFYEQVDVG